MTISEFDETIKPSGARGPPRRRLMLFVVVTTISLIGRFVEFRRVVPISSSSIMEVDAMSRGTSPVANRIQSPTDVNEDHGNTVTVQQQQQDNQRLVFSSSPTPTTLQSSSPPSVLSSCHRSCRSRPNKIVLDNMGAAGFSDRSFIIQIIGDLAGYLCAELYLPPPASMLSTKHNRNQSTSLSVLWTDFFDFTFWDGTNAVQPYDMSSSIRSYEVDEKTTIRFKLRWPTEFKNSTFGRSTDNLLQQIQDMEALVHSQQLVDRQQDDTVNRSSSDMAFIWYIIWPPYKWYRRGTNVDRWFKTRTNVTNPRSQPGRCLSYFSPRPSNISEKVIDRILTRIHKKRPEPQTLALFHIRRGDSVNDCNTTTLPDIYDYLNCSFSNRTEIADHFGAITILLASDEWDKDYRRSVCRFVKNMLGFGCIDLDMTVEKVIKNVAPARLHNNNMFVYHISRCLVDKKRHIRIFLEKRRTVHCLECEDVVKKFGRLGKG